MKSICFLFTKKRVIISSTAAADMKLIIVLYCFVLKLANASSLRLYTHACDLIHEKSTVRTNHRLMAWLHRVIHYLQDIKENVLVICIPKIKVGKKPMKLIQMENFTGLSFSRRLILTMPSLENQPWMRSLPFNLLQL